MMRARSALPRPSLPARGCCRADADTAPSEVRLTDLRNASTAKTNGDRPASETGRRAVLDGPLYYSTNTSASTALVAINRGQDYSLAAVADPT